MRFTLPTVPVMLINDMVLLKERLGRVGSITKHEVGCFVVASINLLFRFHITDQWNNKLLIDVFFY